MMHTNLTLIPIASYDYIANYKYIISKGTFSCVYGNSEEKSGFAVKVFKSKRDDPSREFLNELCVFKHCSSEFILSPLEMKMDKQCTFFVFDRALYDLSNVDARKSWNNNVRNGISNQVILGLKYLHGMQVIHKDLKPMNILVFPNLRIKICDFTSSVIFPHWYNTNPYVVATTLAYRSPEQLLKVNHGYPSDMWSLGCVLFHLYSDEDLLKYDQGDYSEYSTIKQIIKQLGPINPYLSINGWHDGFMSNVYQEYRTKNELEINESPLLLTRLASHLVPENVSKIIQSLLQYDPGKRPNIIQLINSNIESNNEKERLRIMNIRENYPISVKNSSYSHFIPQRKAGIYQLIELAQKNGINIKSLLYSIHLFDKVLINIEKQKKPIITNSLDQKAIIIGCLSIAVQLHEARWMDYDAYDFYFDYGVITDARHVILNIISFDLVFTTVYDYFREYRYKDSKRWKLCKSIIIEYYLNGAVFETDLQEILDRSWAESQNYDSKLEEFAKYSWNLKF
jgi:serine/threonine protein kinase